MYLQPYSSYLILPQAAQLGLESSLLASPAAKKEPEAAQFHLMPRRSSTLNTADKNVPDSRGQAVLAAIIKEHLVTGERSEEHTSELQSQSNLVCRLLLEKKKKKKKKEI